MDYFHHESGKQFDPSIVNYLDEELPIVLDIKAEYSEPE